jgi:cytochrome c oxidase subunit 3
MSTLFAQPAESLPLDEERGSMAMWLFIVTEAMLFVGLFFTYFFYSQVQSRWPMDDPPKLTLAFVMLGVLLTSSVVVQWAEMASRRNRPEAARLAIGVTVGLGLVFLCLQVLEYREHLRTLLPSTDVYGSIFYTITSIHGLHVMLGLCMLMFVLVQPRIDRSDRPPHRAQHNATLYWHFVDVAWIFIVGLLYVLPHVWTR